jgi:hypothetical protein
MLRHFLFTNQDAIECVIEFRISSCTIKRGTQGSRWLFRCHYVICKGTGRMEAYFGMIQMLSKRYKLMHIQ